MFMRHVLWIGTKYLLCYDASEMGVEVKEGMKKRAICARDNEEMEIC